ncbi:hypothetical protein UB45_10920 [Terrabacter sp. 28]|nr:hypothetical protein UB45_10920 [Terrabacter sp. 28]
MAARPRADRTRRRRRRPAYDAYLSSSAWSDKRKHWYAAWLTAAGVEPSCLVCGRRWTLKAGHLNHATYVRLGEESLADLLPLCRRDHRRLHAILDASPSWCRADRQTATAGIIAALRRARPSHCGGADDSTDTGAS